MSDAPETIWLQPLCCAEHSEFGRLWCENDDFDCADGMSGDEYTRADIHAAALIEAERRGMLRAAEMCDAIADIIGARPMSSIHSALCEYRNSIRQAAGELK